MDYQKYRNIINNKWWPFVKKYAQAMRHGFYIEALVLNIYSLRFLLLNLLINFLEKNKSKFKDSYLKQDINKLADTCY